MVWWGCGTGRSFWLRSTRGGELRWEDIDALPPAAFEAVIAYLQAADRLWLMVEGDLVFTALSDVATRLPSVEEMPEAGLSSQFVNRVIGKCARRAGLVWRPSARGLRESAEALRAGEAVHEDEGKKGGSRTAPTS